MGCDIKKCKRMGVVIPDECSEFRCGHYVQQLESKVKAVQSTLEKHRAGKCEPYLIPGGSKEVLRDFFEDIERIVSD